MNQKELIRKNFRDKVFARDGFVCKICGFKPNKIEDLDCHHIVNRFFLPHLGNTPFNGITLCTDRCSTINCHEKAEYYHKKGVPLEGFSPSNLYQKIDSSYEKAYIESLKLKETNDSIEKILILLDIVKNQAVLICQNYNFESSYTTWLLACEQKEITEKFIINYKKEYI